MAIVHHLKSDAAQSASAVRSAEMTVIGETIYMTVIPHLPIDPASTAAEQARAIFAEIERRLHDVGSDKSKIEHVTIWLAHLLSFAEVTEVWNGWIDPDHPPVRACAQVGLANKDLKVEMIVIASK